MSDMAEKCARHEVVRSAGQVVRPPGGNAMAEVQEPIVPTRLYRYRSLIRSSTALAEEIASIRERYLYCADFKRMNDPMEGFYEPSRILEGHADFSRIVRRITDSKSGIGLACFSETYENALMWAHYAGNCTGVCFGYMTRWLLESMQHNVFLARLSYVDEPPLIYPNHALDASSAARRILSQKQYSWSYEREWRLLAGLGKVPYKSGHALTAIYFGSRISFQHRSELLSAIHGLPIEAHEMEIDGYRFSWTPIEIPSRSKRRATRIISRKSRRRRAPRKRRSRASVV